MIYEIKMAIVAFRKEGLVSVIIRIWHYLLKWPRYLLFAIKLKRLYRGSNLDLRAWVDFAFTSHGGIIRPLQIRSEILRLLEKIKPSQPEYILEIGTCNGGDIVVAFASCQGGCAYHQR